MEKISLGNDFINFVFLGGLLFLVISRFILIPNTDSIFKFNAQPEEETEPENRVLYTGLCYLIYLCFFTLLMIPYVKFDLPFFNQDWIQFIVIFSFLCIYEVIRYIFVGGFFFSMGKISEYQDNYRPRYFFIFIKLIVVLLLNCLIYYTKIPPNYHVYFLLGSGILVFVSEWVTAFFFIKNKLKIPSYYVFLYLCTLEILPVLCICKLTFIDN